MSFFLLQTYFADIWKRKEGELLGNYIAKMEFILLRQISGSKIQAKFKKENSKQ